MNTIKRLSMHQRHAHAFQETERDKALFIIAKPIVLEGERRASKDFLRVRKVKAVVLEICSSLGFAPRKSHIENVYTYRIFVKGECGIGLPSKLERRAEAARNAETAQVTASVPRQFQ